MTELTKLRTQFVNLYKERNCLNVTDCADLFDFLTIPLLDRIKSLQSQEERLIDDRMRAIQHSTNWEQLANRNKEECAALTEENEKFSFALGEEKIAVACLDCDVKALKEKCKGLEEQLSREESQYSTLCQNNLLNESHLIELKGKVSRLQTTIRTLCELYGVSK